MPNVFITEVAILNNLQFNDTSTNQGLIQDCEFLVFGSDYGRISGDTKLLQEFTRLLNEGLNKATIKIMTSDTRWQFDDANHTDMPIATTALNSGQRVYELSFDGLDSHMAIDRVEILTEGNVWKKLDAFDLSDIDQADAEFYKTNGTPKAYDKRGNTITLYPAPSYTQSSSLKVFYQREPSYFETSDTTKRAGIPTPFSRLISLYACEDFTVSKNMTEKIAQITSRRQEMEQDMQNFYNRRDKEDRPKLAIKRHSFK